jgi:hypothetical protein
VSGPAALCRFAGHTCAACCWGERVPPPALRSRLRRQTRLFRRQFPGGRPPGRLALLLYELRARGGLDLLWAALLLVPLLGDWLRPWLKARAVCAFLGHEGDGEVRVGCLLHPARWEGRDGRGAAFALLPGFACGRPDYFCLAAHFFAAADWRERERFARRVAGLGWYGYSLAARSFQVERDRPERVGGL